jgi:hypothetical protein
MVGNKNKPNNFFNRRDVYFDFEVRIHYYTEHAIALVAIEYDVNITTEVE